MKQMKWITILLVMALLLVACGGAAAPEAEEPAEEPAAAEEEAMEEEEMEEEEMEEEMEEEPTAVPEEEAMDEGEKVQVRWFVGLGTGSNEDQIPIQEEVVAEFNESQDKIELVVEFVDNASATDALNTQIAGGNSPDIIGPVGVAGRAAFTDALLDLQPLIDANGYDLGDFDPAMVDFYNLESRGQVGLPFGIFPSFIFFNKDLFDEAGLPYPPQEFGQPYVDADGNEKPWNVDTVRELGMLLTVDGNGNDATSPDFDAENIVQFGFGYQWADIRGRATMWGAGSFADADGNAVIPDHWRESMHWYHDAMWADSFYPNGVYGGSEILGGGNWFESGNMAMDHVHLWYATCCTAGLDAEWDLAVMPAAPDGSITAKMHADTFAILEGSENPDAAFEVLSYLIGPAADKLTKLYGGLPARLSLQGAYFDTIGDTVEHLNGRDINWDVVIQSMAYPDNPNHEEGMPNELQARDILAEFDQLMSNDPDFDVDAGLDDMQQKLQEVFDQAN
ncbi:MAG: extracellular solute-binding protein [Chloroflexota bacterium]